MKLKYKVDLQGIKGGFGIYQWLKRENPELLERLLPSIVWDKENCKKEALKYKTKKAWGENSSSSYSVARKKRWVDYCCQHMLIKKDAEFERFLEKLPSHISFKVNQVWKGYNYKYIFIDKDFGEFEKLARSLLNCMRLGLRVGHKKRTSSRISMQRFIYNIDLKSFYKGISHTAKKFRISDSHLYTFLAGKNVASKTVGGYHWRYATPKELKLIEQGKIKVIIK